MYNATIVAVEKQYYIFCVSAALVNQHAKHIHNIILPAVVCLALHIFTHYLIKAQFPEKNLLDIKCMF
jgi:hypothetical protein